MEIPYPKKTKWEIALKARYKSGLGGSWDIQTKPTRLDHCEAMFGSTLYGTMNFMVDRKGFDKVRRELVPAKKGFWLYHGKLSPVFFYPCSINGETSCWFVEQRHVMRNSAGAHPVELLSRRMVDKRFLTDPVTLTFYSKWPEAKIDAWWPGKCKWFQSFDWGPTRADSQLVWDTIKKKCDWAGKRVLDVGCSTGWYSFKATEHGAIVDGVDTMEKMVDLARVINNNIEMKDVDFYRSDQGGKYDTILYLSVHHSFDPDYKMLRKTLNGYLSRCKNLFVELHAPPPRSKISAEDVDRIMGVKPLLRYNHKVRGTRNVYHLES